ncbi:MAG: hypothetical protein V3S55_15465 [Nitrospiraceae bacterium]
MAGFIDLAVEPSYVHSFAGVVFFNEPQGTTPVQPSAGTITFTVVLEVQRHASQPVLDNVLQANTVDQVDWAGNTLSVKATFSGIIGATHARLIVAGNSA